MLIHNKVMCIQQSIKPLRSPDSITVVPSPSQDNKSKLPMEDVATPRTEANSPSRELRSPVASSLPELPFSVSPKSNSKKSMGKKTGRGANQICAVQPKRYRSTVPSQEQLHFPGDCSFVLLTRGIRSHPKRPHENPGGHESGQPR